MDEIEQKQVRRIRIGERYYTISQIAREAGVSAAAIHARIKAGDTEHQLMRPQAVKSVSLYEQRLRQKIREKVRTKYKRTCPNCGCAFDIFQPAHILKTVKPGGI